MAAPNSDLEKTNVLSSTTKSTDDDLFIVRFDIPDRLNPKDWTTTKKWAVTAVLSATGFNRIMVSTIVAPALPVIAHDFHVSDAESVMAMSVYLLATAFGPLIIAPLSEVYGRGPVLHATNVWFLVWNVVCGFANNNSLLIAARLLAGFGASAVYVLANAVLGDIWRPEERGRSLGIYILIPLLGAAIGPILGGFIVQHTTWRWIFWSTSALQLAMVIFSFIVFDETYEPVILKRKARSLRAIDVRYRTAHTDDPSQALRRSISRPLRLLLFHPIIQLQALLCGFGYGITYLVLSTYSDLWIKQYDATVSVSGLHYISMCLGEILGALIGGYTLDLAYRLLKKRDPESPPENRIFSMAPGILIGAAGLLWYGWAAQTRLYWLIVDTGAVVYAMGLGIGLQALQAYVIDSYPRHVSSASAATQVFRSLAAFGFPLFAPTMYSRIGYGWANSVIAFVCIGMAIVPPIVIWRFGASMRKAVKSSD